ncbi:uncharacterized protein LOC116430213 [Nomia melanderi]|uniref:uncharacterized protein LOC116430213 n=1 Tax=Nomia melanderi TaxID=2448451 RepID=UPI001304141A|nr:uncharacterized protein LOC116430213 [Nomia melanderi]
MEEFKYIIQKQEQQQICFGSRCPRDTSKKGMSSFMRHYTLEDYPNVSPNSYNALASYKAIKTKPCSHSISKKGYSGIARFAKQVLHKNDYSSSFDYNIPMFPKQLHEPKYSFKHNSKKRSFGANTIPGPGMYTSAKGGGIAFMHNFGGRVQMKLGVDLKCCIQNTDVCKKCKKQIVDDYWHLKNKIFLCRSCLTKEYETQDTYKKSDLTLFRKIRDCSVIHQHCTTTAKIWLMYPNVVTQWIRREAYLSGYLKG